MDAPAKSIPPTRRISDAVLALLSERPNDKVKVVDVCRRAGVNRSTFYYYYHEPGEVVDEILRRIYAPIMSHAPAKDYTDRSYITSALTASVSALRTHADELGILLRSLEAPRAEQMHRESFMMGFKASSSPVLDRSAYGEYLAEYLLAGQFGIVRKWILEGCSTPREDIVRLLVDLGELFANSSIGK